MPIGHSVRGLMLIAGVAVVGTAGVAGATTFPAPVEAWRAPIEAKTTGMGLPIDFILTWVKHESYGNPCALGVPGKEAGIAQTWHPDDDRFGATFDELRAACVEMIAINKNVKPFASLAQRQRLFNNAEKTGGVVVEPADDSSGQ